MNNNLNQQYDICFVCGYMGENIYEEAYLSCPCCGSMGGEYENRENTYRLESLRKRWAKNGFQWHLKKEKLKDWDPKNQLRNLKLSAKEIKELIQLFDPKEYEKKIKETVLEPKDSAFLSFGTLKAAKKNNNGYMYMKGDFGNQVYLSIPAKLIKCDEETLKKLLHKIDEICHNDFMASCILFKNRKEGQIISGGLGGGIVDNKLWVHKKLKHLEDKISLILSAKVGIFRKKIDFKILTNTSNELIEGHESAVRKMVSESKGKKYFSFKSLKNAKKHEKSYLIMEGDYGGQIYLSFPVKLIKCDEDALRKLLKKFDQQCWDDMEGTGMYFEQMEKGQRISGGMGGGIADNELWVHKELEHMKDEINGILRGKGKVDEFTKNN
ncbi:MAG: hypothetical protein ABID64_02870 [Nitrospirota bacterium]